MKGCYFLIAVIFFIFSISAYAIEKQGDLYGKYKGMMQKDVEKISNNNTKSQASSAERRQLEQSIAAINGMKKGIFESTADFTQRRHAEIVRFEKEVQQAVTAGDAAYQAGILTMTAYDADQEVLQADFAWNKEVLALLPGLQERKNGFMKIPRKEAKNNFAAQKTHPVFITVAWGTNSVQAAKMIMPGKGNKLWRVVNTPLLIGQYIDHGNGTITDTKIGLMWKRCSEGLSGNNCEHGKAEEYIWDDATQRFKNVDYAGYSDWRLPTIDELKTLVYCSKGKDKEGDCKHGSESPTINPQAFPKTEKWIYWSGSPNAFSSDGAWYVNFNGGNSFDDHRGSNYAVRLVRGGQ